MNKPQYNPKLTSLHNFKIAYEYGKRESKEKINNLIDEQYFEWFPDFKGIPTMKCKSCKNILKHLENDYKKLKEKIKEV